jgi:hypothetical protein
MSETQLYNDILAAYSSGPRRLFRINAGGIAWQGAVMDRTATRLVLAYPRQIHLAPAGFSDLVGWSPDEEGRAIFTAVEGKSATGRLNSDQLRFIELVNTSGGRAGVARSVEEAGAILTKPLVF